MPHQTTASSRPGPTLTRRSVLAGGAALAADAPMHPAWAAGEGPDQSQDPTYSVIHPRIRPHKSNLAPSCAAGHDIRQHSRQSPVMALFCRSRMSAQCPLLRCRLKRSMQHKH
jgi:hypothetical protein